jgi:sec-independent protein translocase protein TatA
MLAFLPGGSEWFYIFMAATILFGGKKIPELARGLGRSIGEFKRGKAEFDREVQNAMKDSPPPVEDSQNNKAKKPSC